MTSLSEATYGQRYQHGIDLIACIRTFSDYAPTNANLTIDSLEALLKQIDMANSDVTSRQNAIALGREKRNDGYYGDRGLKKRSAMIRDYLASLPEGRNSISFKSVQVSCQKLVNYQKSKSPKTEPTKKTSSQSETSFGSMLQQGKSILAIISALPVYAPTNADLRVDNFKAFLLDLEACNQTVAELQIALSQAIQNRAQLYEGDTGLRSRFTMIKSYVASTFSKQSAEYAQVLKVKY